MLFLALEVAAYHGLSRAMEKRTAKTKLTSHLYVVMLHLLHVFFLWLFLLHVKVNSDLSLSLE